MWTDSKRWFVIWSASRDNGDKTSYLINTSRVQQKPGRFCKLLSSADTMDIRTTENSNKDEKAVQRFQDFQWQEVDITRRITWKFAINLLLLQMLCCHAMILGQDFGLDRRDRRPGANEQTVLSKKQ